MLQFGIRAGFCPGSDLGQRFMGLVFQRFSMFRNWGLKKKKFDTKKSSIIRLVLSVSDFFFFLCRRRPSLCLFPLFSISCSSSFVVVEIPSRFSLRIRDEFRLSREEL